MKMVAFNGSPRAEKGNTHVIVEAFLKGAATAGAEVENIFLARKEINPCRGCLACWLKTPGHCVTDDDMAELLEKFGSCDVAVFATPLYVDNVSGITKNFMDRFMPGADPHFSKDEGGECRHIPTIKPPKIVVISNCGFPEKSHFQVLKLLFKRVARNMNTEVLGEIYRSGGAILAEHPVMLKPLIYRYKQLVQKAGVQIVENGGISEELQTLLGKPLLPENVYIEQANRYFDQVLGKLE
ncbi:MAG: flavodoxin family protein [Planctomycetota bacterium]|jgi:multimeric flavodoxin WrbA